MRFLRFLLEQETFTTQELDKLNSFSKKIQYAKSKLKEIGSGSSRIVFQLTDNKVLKLAKNKKGLDQNIVDGDSEKHKMFPDIIPEIFDRDESDDCYWIIVKAAEKIKPTDFKNLTGIPFNEFSKAIKEYSLYTKRKIEDVSEETQKLLNNNKFFREISDIIKKYDLLTGDIIKISSWGKINNKAVLIDAGLNREVFNKHFKRK